MAPPNAASARRACWSPPRRCSTRTLVPAKATCCDAIGGVLCRCTGYRKIVDAILDAANPPRTVSAPIAGRAVGARVPRLDGMRKIDGADLFGADGHPAEALVARAIRSPFHRAGFRLGDVGAWAAAHPGIMRVFTAADVPGRNAFGVIAPCADQPVFAAEEARFKGEAVALVVGEAEAMAALDLATFPVSWDELPALTTIEAALAADAPLLHADRAGNVLTRGRVVRGDVDAALASADVVAEGAVETGFVEHAYIEPEAGCAVRVGDRIEITACTQAPYMDRDDVAAILGIAPEAVRIVPTAVGGGFGSKLDLSIQPFIAVAAWHLPRPVRMVYSRPESMMATTKRHPARIKARAGATRDGKIVGLDFSADFNTGAYASWGPTVANRVPVHASGPYFVPIIGRSRARCTPTSCRRARSAASACRRRASRSEQLYDELADKLGNRSARVSHRQRVVRRPADRDRPGARRRRRHPRLSGGAAAALAPGPRRRGGVQRDRPRQPPPRGRALRACGTDAATPRSPTPRPFASA